MNLSKCISKFYQFSVVLFSVLSPFVGPILIKLICYFFFGKICNLQEFLSKSKLNELMNNKEKDKKKKEKKNKNKKKEKDKDKDKDKDQKKNNDKNKKSKDASRDGDNQSKNDEKNKNRKEKQNERKKGYQDQKNNKRTRYVDKFKNFKNKFTRNGKNKIKSGDKGGFKGRKSAFGRGKNVVHNFLKAAKVSVNLYSRVLRSVDQINYESFNNIENKEYVEKSRYDRINEELGLKNIEFIEEMWEPQLHNNITRLNLPLKNYVNPPYLVHHDFNAFMRLN
ncbi:hypothetical protein EDEG_03718 [Edhazardia aedis USNM 41457]|uniref:Uncharacterized protein n=1 Tax=Edhazardia aedis (strain USNM 41457) TaxID=1003232 RepID=J8ZQ21_EDHAE|nr:hypothetical protein EDEG_03718 [Edhazardia aedis USNM 41457]|eukprot:EJW01793.1 hypothetical protein EDEG_03718 [Edhazardia aedis USNM 41457]